MVSVAAVIRSFEASNWFTSVLQSVAATRQVLPDFKILVRYLPWRAATCKSHGQSNHNLIVTLRQHRIQCVGGIRNQVTYSGCLRGNVTDLFDAMFVFARRVK